MLGELLHLIRALEKRAASAAVTDSIAHRLANPVAPSPIQSVQKGTISLNAASVDATITSVSTGKAFALLTGKESGVSAYDGKTHEGWVELFNATTVRGHRNWSGTENPLTVAYVVVEYK